jgi:hypothetical protein
MTHSLLVHSGFATAATTARAAVQRQVRVMRRGPDLTRTVYPYNPADSKLSATATKLSSPYALLLSSGLLTSLIDPVLLFIHVQCTCAPPRRTQSTPAQSNAQPKKNGTSKPKSSTFTRKRRTFQLAKLYISMLLDAALATSAQSQSQSQSAASASTPIPAAAAAPQSTTTTTTTPTPTPVHAQLSPLESHAVPAPPSLAPGSGPAHMNGHSSSVAPPHAHAHAPAHAQHLHGHGYAANHAPPPSSTNEVRDHAF